MSERKESAANKVRYFLILGRTAGKREHGDSLYAKAQGWVPDTGHEIAD
ncbi:hypothetical protein [Changpingibacter yushuensis]|nr:hypothetical protein [Changpingibacter yushuensis]